MKLTNKKLFVVALAAISSFGLVGCNNSGDKGSVNPDKKVEVVWWNNYQEPDLKTTTEEDARKSNTYREYYYAKDLIAEFNKTYPNITITTSYHGSYGNILKDVQDVLDSGNTPTIASCYGDHVATYNAADATFDMSDFAKELEKDTDFNQSYLTAEKGMFEGQKYLSLPYSKSAETLVLNAQVWEKAGAGKAGEDSKSYVAPEAADTKIPYDVPENIFQMMDIARRIKADFPAVFENQRDPDTGYFNAVPFCWDSTENMFITMLENSGVGYTGTSGSLVSRIKWNTEGAKDILKNLKKWNNEGLFATQNQLYETDSVKHYHQYGSSMVANGVCFASVSSTAGARYFVDNGFTASFYHGLNYAAGTKAEDAKVISQGPSLTFFKKADADVNKAAFTFYKFLTNTENSAKLAKNTSYFPLRASSYENADVKALTDAATSPITNETKGANYSGSVLNLNQTYTEKGNYFLSPVFEGSADMRTVIGNMVNEVLNKSIDETDTDEELNAVVDAAFNTAYTALTK